MQRPTLALLAVIAAGAATAATASTAHASQPLGALGPKAETPQATYEGYYDGHKDTYLLTDVSSKSQAAALHVNYSAAIGTVKGAPAQYFILGPVAKGQVAVFGSEPGESDYNPLWEELIVRWKPGVTPVLLKQDDQINALAKQGELTVADAHMVINAPITHVG
jgi:hypothetical protein